MSSAWLRRAVVGMASGTLNTYSNTVKILCDARRKSKVPRPNPKRLIRRARPLSGRGFSGLGLMAARHDGLNGLNFVASSRGDAVAGHRRRSLRNVVGFVAERRHEGSRGIHAPVGAACGLHASRSDACSRHPLRGIVRLRFLPGDPPRADDPPSASGMASQ